MFNLGMGEITVILLLALIFLGPKKLPELASGLGRIIKDIRKATSDVKNEIQLDEHIRKPFEELRDAVMLPPEELKRRDRIKKDIEDAKRKAEADLAILAASGDPDAAANASAPAHGEEAPGSSGVPVPPPFPNAGSGPHSAGVPVPPPFPNAGSGPNSGRAPVPPPFHHATGGSGPVAAAPVVPGGAPVGTIPTGYRNDRSPAKGLPLPSHAPHPPHASHLPPVPRPPVAAAVPTAAPKPHAEKSNVTQFLSEADLIPPGAPPPVPGNVPANVAGKLPTAPGTHGKNGEATADATAETKADPADGVS